jgi:hypothetical protein
VLDLDELGDLAEGAGGPVKVPRVAGRAKLAQDDLGSDAFFLGPAGFECGRDDRQIALNLLAIAVLLLLR